jgi:hypothetical protein
MNHNKSLQLSPQRSSGSVHAVWQFHLAVVDAAVKLNSVLCSNVLFKVTVNLWKSE